MPCHTQSKQPASQLPSPASPPNSRSRSGGNAIGGKASAGRAFGAAICVRMAARAHPINRRRRPHRAAGPDRLHTSCSKGYRGSTAAAERYHEPGGALDVGLEQEGVGVHHGDHRRHRARRAERSECVLHRRRNVGALGGNLSRSERVCRREHLQRRAASSRGAGMPTGVRESPDGEFGVHHSPHRESASGRATPHLPEGAALAILEQQRLELGAAVGARQLARLHREHHHVARPRLLVRRERVEALAEHLDRLEVRRHNKEACRARRRRRRRRRRVEHCVERAHHPPRRRVQVERQAARVRLRDAAQEKGRARIEEGQQEDEPALQLAERRFATCYNDRRIDHARHSAGYRPCAHHHGRV
eukprot:5151354-Prymnesium_polylepis.2